MKEIDKDELEEIIRSKKGEVEAMEEVIERLKRDLIKEGLKEGISSIIKNMLQKGIKVNEINELTGVSKKEIEQIKQSLEQM